MQCNTQKLNTTANTNVYFTSLVVVLLCCDLGNNGYMGTTIVQLMEIPKISLVEHIHCQFKNAKQYYMNYVLIIMLLILLNYQLKWYIIAFSSNVDSCNDMNKFKNDPISGKQGFVVGFLGKNKWRHTIVFYFTS